MSLIGLKGNCKAVIEFTSAAIRVDRFDEGTAIKSSICIKNSHSRYRQIIDIMKDSIFCPYLQGGIAAKSAIFFLPPRHKDTKFF
jgi:hypothetical protein